MATTYVIVGGGTAGCVVAGRLSEDPDNHVILVEAGMDYPPDAVPEDIAASYAGRALYNRGYFWPGMQAARSEGAPPSGYELPRVMGGGSSINGQVALRGAAEDYDRWQELGAAGWDWRSVLPYFRRLETDMDFVGQDHGDIGPVAIRRYPREDWDGFTAAIVETWERQGHAHFEDMNATLGEGWGCVPVSHDGKRRASTAVGYLDAKARARKNLRIVAGAEARRLVLDGRKVTGVEIDRAGVAETIAADHVVVSAGALRSPWLLLKSGIGPASDLAKHDIVPVVDLKGVGRNLQDHPTVSVVAYMAPGARRRVLRHNFVNLVYSSGMADMRDRDMVMSVICKTAWHALGDRFGALSTYVGKPFSRGSVELGQGGEDANPSVRFNWLQDERDLERACQSFRMMVEMLRSPSMRDSVLEIFAAGFSPKVKKIGALTTFNRVLTNVTGAMMDASGLLRHQIIRRVASDGISLDTLLADEDLLGRYMRETTTGIWHPCGTCRMGARDDGLAVVDPAGAVYGLENLTVADASIMPEIPTTNLNIPVAMIGEKIADGLRHRPR